MRSGLQMMISIQMFKDAFGLTNDISLKCLKMRSGLQMMISIQMFKDALGLTNDNQYSNV